MSRVRVAIIICWLAAVVYNLPRFFERSTTAQTSNSSVSAAALVSRTAFRENTTYIVIYKTVLFFVARFLLPFSALAYFNTRHISTVKIPPTRQETQRFLDVDCSELTYFRYRLQHSPHLVETRRPVWQLRSYEDLLRLCTMIYKLKSLTLA